MTPAISPPLAQALEAIRRQADSAGVFAEVTLADGVLRCRAKDAAAEAWYEAAARGDGLVVRLTTADRWLSESIEADLMHTGDSLEELIEDELIELGYEASGDAAMTPVKHFRSDDRLYTFENVVPLEDALSRGDHALAAAIAGHYLLAYEAAFRELGDMSGGDE